MTEPGCHPRAHQPKGSRPVATVFTGECICFRSSMSQSEVHSDEHQRRVFEPSLSQGEEGRIYCEVVRKEREERVCGREEQTAAMGKCMRNRGK